MKKIVFNPSTSLVDHNVNGTIYRIKPGGQIAVDETDVLDLVKLLSFLIVLEEDGSGTVAEMNRLNELEMKKVSPELIEELRKQHQEVAGATFRCEKNIVQEELNGQKKTVQCGFETMEKKALLAHVKDKHNNSKTSPLGSEKSEADSPKVVSDEEDSVDEKATARRAKRLQSSAE